MPTSPLSDEALVRQIKANGTDPNLLGVLLERHQDAVVRACYHHVKDHDAAQDLAQEVFLRVITRIQEFKQQCTFDTWLHSIVHNRCVDHLRRDKRALHQDISERIADRLADELDDEEVLDPDALLGMVEVIGGETKFLLLLKYQEGWSARQIAQATGLEESVIKMRLHRAKTRLRALLTPKEAKRR